MKYDIFKNKFLSKTLASWCAFATLATMCGPAWAAVATGDYLGGAANLNRASSGVDNYGTQTATYAGFTANGGTGVLDWNRLNVPASATLEFNNGTFYNVVNSAGGMTTIAGMLSGTGNANVSIFNPNGISIANGATVSVEGIFGAFAFGIQGSDLDNWINNGTMPAIVKGTAAATTDKDVTVSGGASISAAQIALAGKKVTVGASGNEATLDGAVAVAAGSNLKVTIDSVAGGTISMKLGESATAGDVDMFAAFENTFGNEGGLAIAAAGKVNVESSTKIAIGDGDMDMSKVDGGITAGGATTITSKKAVFVAAGADGSAEKVAVRVKSGDLTITTGATEDESYEFAMNNAGINVDNGNLKVEAGGLIQIKGKSTIEASGDLAFNAKDGSFTADGYTTAGDGKVLIKSTGAGDVQIDAANAIVLRDNAQIVGNNVTMTAKGNEGVSVDITETADSKIEATGIAKFTAAKGKIELLGTANDFSKGGVDKVVDATAKNVTINEGGDVSGDNTGISLGIVKATAGDVKVTDTTGTITAKGATVEATKGNVIVSAAKDVVIGDAATANATIVKAGQNIRIESQNGAVDIVSRVTAGKNLTIVSEKATTGSKVKIDAKYLNGEKNILTAEDGSVYVAAQANDIEINNGTVVTATDKTKTDSSAAGNILLKSEIGSVTPAEGTATIVADNGKGVAALVGGGAVGNKNLTIKAGVTVLNSTGKGADTPDVKAEFEGDTKLVANAVHDVDVDIVGGTLTIDSQANALAGENVNEVKYTPGDPVAVTLEKHELKAYANDSRGAEAGNDIKIQGYSANLVVAPNSAAIAGHDVKTTIDRDTTVYGTMEAGNDAFVRTDWNLSTPGGKIVAGKDLFVRVGTSTPMINIAVGKGVSAVSGERAIAFRTVGGYAYPEVYGNNSDTAVFIDGRVAGGNSADFSILQGYEQAAAAGNFFLMPAFTLTGNIFPLLNDTDMQSPGAAFAQGYLSSDKGEISEMVESEAEEKPEGETAEGETAPDKVAMR